MGPAEQTYRLRELDRLSIVRPLSLREIAERDRLHDRIAMRVWRQQRRELDQRRRSALEQEARS